MNIEVLAKITIKDNSFDNQSKTYGEYLEDTSKLEKEMYYNYLMDFTLRSDYSLKNPTPLSFNEWIDMKNKVFSVWRNL